MLETRNRFSLGAMRFGNNFPVGVTAAKVLTALTVELGKFMKGIIKWDSCNIRTINLMTHWSFSSPMFPYKAIEYHADSSTFNHACFRTRYASILYVLQAI